MIDVYIYRECIHYRGVNKMQMNDAFCLVGHSSFHRRFPWK